MPTYSPQPPWAQVHLEFFEQPGFIDDCFRSSTWTKIQSAASESFTVTTNISGDYAVMSVTEGAVVNGAGWERDISSLALQTDDYPILFCRIRGGGTTPQYKLEVEYTDATTSDTGWVNATTQFFHAGLQLTAGKTINAIRLYARSNTANATATIDYDYAIIAARPPIIPFEHYDLEAELTHTVANSSFNFKTIWDKLQPWIIRKYLFDWGTSIIVGATKIYDLSDHEDIQTGQNITFTTGYNGYCLSFASALNSRVSTGWKPNIAADEARTIMFRVKASPGETGVLMGVGDSAGVWRRIQFNWSNDKVRLYVRDNNGNVLQYTTTTTIADNSWHSIIGIIDPDNNRIAVYVDGDYDGGASGTLGAIDISSYEFTLGCLNNSNVYSNYTDEYLDEVVILNKALSVEEINYFLSFEEPLPGASRVDPGAWCFLYVAADGESLVHGLVKGRVIEIVRGGDPDAPYKAFYCEDRGEIIHERTFSENYTSATQISTVVDDIVDNSIEELYQDKDTTNRTIQNKFVRENCWSLLQKLAEAATFATGETGANFWVDPGGALKFKKYGAFSSPETLTDGSDGSDPNILEIQYKESIKEEPKLVNDCKVVIFEEETYPIDGDALTESAEGWSSPDPTDGGFPQSDAGDKVEGTASIHFNTTNPGTIYRMRLSFPDFDITGWDTLKFYLKHGATLNIDNFRVRIWRSSIWTTDYYEKDPVAAGVANAWNEYTIDLSTMSKTGNPGPIINVIEIAAEHSTQIGTGGFLIDKLRFVREEKYGSHQNAASISAFGRRRLRIVDKSITNLDFAEDLAENIVENRKYPITIIKAKVPGKGQSAYIPPQIITVYCEKEGLVGDDFQIQKATHKVDTKQGYTVDLVLIAAKTAHGVYSTNLSPVLTDINEEFARLRKTGDTTGLSTLHNTYLE